MGRVMGAAGPGPQVDLGRMGQGEQGEACCVGAAGQGPEAR